MKKLLLILPLLLIFAWCTTPQERCAELSWVQKKACECAKIVCFNGWLDGVDVTCMAMCMESNITK